MKVGTENERRGEASQSKVVDGLDYTSVAFDLAREIP
jgi:hypothetical protein